jgi:hypothetical protein
MEYQLKEQQELLDYLREVFKKILDKIPNKTGEVRRYINPNKPIFFQICEESIKLRRMIFQSDYEALKKQQTYVDSLNETFSEYHRKSNRFRNQLYRENYDQEVLNPHYELMKKEEEKLRQMIIDL